MSLSKQFYTDTKSYHEMLEKHTFNRSLMGGNLYHQKIFLSNFREVLKSIEQRDNTPDFFKTIELSKKVPEDLSTHPETYNYVKGLENRTKLQNDMLIYLFYMQIAHGGQVLKKHLDQRFTALFNSVKSRNIIDSVRYTQNIALTEDYNGCLEFIIEQFVEIKELYNKFLK